MQRFLNHPPRAHDYGILAIGAHSDDVELGALGFLLQANAAGARITICVLTDGRRGGTTSARRDEATAVARSMGAELIWAGLPDTRVALRPAITAIERAIADVEPSLVLVHDPRDTHQDHRAAARAVLSAARDVPNVYYYEGPSSRRFAPLAYVSIDSEMSQKLELLRLHRSQLRRRPFDQWARVTALYRGLHARPPCRYAEAFRPVRQELLLNEQPFSTDRRLIRVNQRRVKVESFRSAFSRHGGREKVP
jgi:LmbE family N-acetylglucosaminyl deacetylase